MLFKCRQQSRTCHSYVHRYMQDSGDYIFSLFDFRQILLNKSTCKVSHVYQNKYTSLIMVNERTTSCD